MTTLTTILSAVGAAGVLFLVLWAICTICKPCGVFQCDDCGVYHEGGYRVWQEAPEHFDGVRVVRQCVYCAEVERILSSDCRDIKENSTLLSERKK